MGHFSSKAARDEYVQTFCDYCAHQPGCATMWLQMYWNEDVPTDPEKAKILDKFIPQVGRSNMPCTQHAERMPEQLSLPF